MKTMSSPNLPTGEADLFFKGLKESTLGVDEVREYINANKWLVNHRDPNTQATPVVLAAMAGDVEIVKLLKEHGADLAVTDRGDQGAAFYAGHGGHREVIRYLVEQGIDVTAKNSAGISAADAARANDFFSFGDEIERMMVERHAKLQAEIEESVRAAREAYDANLRDVTKVMRGGLDKRVPALKTARFGAQKP